MSLFDGSIAGTRVTKVRLVFPNKTKKSHIKSSSSPMQINIARFSRICATLKDIKKSVFLSQSKDIYTNLALEDWLYRNFDFTYHHVLMLWQNNPCVVIGKHQNPWLEATISEFDNITEHGIKLARRNSGGGAVFHDLGNLNMTFFTPREHYNRRHNLEVVTKAVFKEYGIQLEISPREDLTLRKCKISGTAAKLGRPTAYHHCTLLVNVDEGHLQQALQKLNLSIETYATKSIKTRIINLCEENPSISIPTLCKAIGSEYLQNHHDIKLCNIQKEFQTVDPSDKCFPGIQEIRENLQNWEWLFGKTPKFKITISPGTVAIDNIMSNTNNLNNLKMTVVVESGKIIAVNLLDFVGNNFIGDGNFITRFIGHKFSEQTLNNLKWSLQTLVSNKCEFLVNC